MKELEQDIQQLRDDNAGLKRRVDDQEGLLESCEGLIDRIMGSLNRQDDRATARQSAESMLRVLWTERNERLTGCPTSSSSRQPLPPDCPAPRPAQLHRFPGAPAPPVTTASSIPQFQVETTPSCVPGREQQHGSASLKVHVDGHPASGHDKVITLPSIQIVEPVGAGVAEVKMDEHGQASPDARNTTATDSDLSLTHAASQPEICVAPPTPDAVPFPIPLALHSTTDANANPSPDSASLSVTPAPAGGAEVPTAHVPGMDPEDRQASPDARTTTSTQSDLTLTRTASQSENCV